jgi:hypothetical protein
MPGLDYVHRVHTPDSTVQHSTLFFPIRYFVNCQTWCDASALPGSDCLQPDIEAGLMCGDVSAACIRTCKPPFKKGTAWPGQVAGKQAYILTTLCFHKQTAD